RHPARLHALHRRHADVHVHRSGDRRADRSPRRRALSRLTPGFVTGLLFALGPGIAGLPAPVKVTLVLDGLGARDPRLGLVMAGAIAVHLIPNWLIFRRGRPMLDTRFHLPSFVEVDARLVGGAALFGVGWGLAGYCPGPAV